MAYTIRTSPRSHPPRVRLALIALLLVVGGVSAWAQTPYPLKVPLGLETTVPIPADNPLTVEKVELGKMLFFDKRLSSDGSVSCATCHDPRLGFSDSKVVATGVHGGKGERNSPVVFNRAWSTRQMWDARVPTLEEQALMPIENPKEMASTAAAAVNVLNAIPGYREQFEKVFGGPPTPQRLGLALAAFERTLMSGNSPYDRYKAGDKTALSAAAERGVGLFFSKFRCDVCHSGPNFTNEQLSPRCYPAVTLLSGRDAPVNKQLREMYKTPTLRNVAQSGPYLHNGHLSTLADVIEFYQDTGPAPQGMRNRKTFPVIHVTEGEKADLVAFLEALTGEPIDLKEPVLPQ